MSSNLTWVPNVVQEKVDLSTDLKFIIRKRYGNPIDVTVDEAHRLYFEGLHDAGIKDAIKVMAAIDTYSKINLKEEN